MARKSRAAFLCLALGGTLCGRMCEGPTRFLPQEVRIGQSSPAAVGSGEFSLFRMGVFNFEGTPWFATMIKRFNFRSGSSGIFLGGNVRQWWQNLNPYIDDVNARMEKVSNVLSEVPLVALQEVFQTEHAVRMLARSGHDVGLLADARRSDFVSRLWCTNCSGLSLFARRAEGKVLAWGWQAFRHCSGFFSRGSDCLATKAVQWALLRLPNGALVYVLNTHLDAGGRDGMTRDSQLAEIRELKKELRARARDAAFVIAGDFNSEGAAEVLGMTDLARTDAWPRGVAVKGDSPRIFFQNGECTRIAPRAGAFLVPSYVISDHELLVGDFEVLSRCL